MKNSICSPPFGRGRGRVQTGKIVYRINRAHGLQCDGKEKSKLPVSSGFQPARDLFGVSTRSCAPPLTRPRGRGHQSVRLRFASFATRMQKIEVATLVSLGYVRRVQGSKATRVPWGFRFPGRATPGHLAIIDAEIEFPFSHI